jgi:type I restriction enzyme S subunit
MKNGNDGAAERIAGVVEAGLSVDNLIENFDVVANAAGGIACLRTLIRELAVQGAISTREKASFDVQHRIEQLRAEKRRLGVDAEIRPVEIEGTPAGWVTLPLSDIALDFQNGLSKRTGAEGMPYPVIRLADIERGKLRQDNLREIQLTDKELKKYAVLSGDVLVIRVNGSADLVGSFVPCTVERRWAYSDHLIRVRVPRAEVDPRYLCLFAATQQARRMLSEKTVTTAGQKTINQEGLGSLLVPLPPLVEQQAIVAKVDHLLALFDDLEAQQSKKREVGALFTRSAFDALATADSPTELDRAWSRVSGRFNELVGLVERMRNVRELIVELAIRGRLVAGAATDVQVPGLEPAGVEPYALPDMWQWVRLENITSDIVDCLHSTPRYTQHGVPAIRTADVVPGKILLEQARLVDDEQYKDRVRRLVPVENDVVYSREGERLGIAACVPQGVKLCLAQRMMHIRLRSSVHAPFVMWAMNSRFVYSQAVGGTGGSTSPHVNMKSIRQFLIPVPPLSQQQRIVRKMEQLLGICDALESRLRTAEDRAARFAEAAVRELVA